MSYQYASRNYYNDERRIFAEAYGIRLTDEEAKKILKKLNTHYSKEMKKNYPFQYIPLLPARIKFRGHRGSGNYYNGRITLSHNPSMGLLLHEFAHYAKDRGIFKHLYTNIPNRGTAHHGLHFDICLTRIHDYAKSKGYWKSKMHSEMFIAAAKKAYDEAPIPEEMFKPVVPEGVATIKEVKEILDIAAGV